MIQREDNEIILGYLKDSLPLWIPLIYGMNLESWCVNPCKTRAPSSIPTHNVS